MPSTDRAPRRRIVTFGAAAAFLLVALFLLLGSGSSRPKYATAAVRRGSITSAVEATGTINPLTTVPVGSSVSGTVKYIFADFNTRVRAGQVLAQLDPDIYQAQVLTARGNLANARANLKNLEASLQVARAGIEVGRANVAKLEADLVYARANARRITDLHRQGLVPQDQKDLTQSSQSQADAAVRAAEAQVNQARAQLQQGKAQVDQARAQIEAMTGQLEQAQANLRYTTILSPTDGIVVARNITVGQSVAASLQAPNVFTIAQDLERMQVYAKTDESDTGFIRVGAETTFQVDAFPSEVFRGRVSAIRLNAYIVQNVVTYDTIIDFENPQERLLPGETAYVTIPTGHAEDALEVPNAAMTFTPPLPARELETLYRDRQIPAAAYTSHAGGQQVVWRVVGSRIEPVAVKVGISDYSVSQLLGGDLKEQDILVTGLETSSASTPSGRGPVPSRARNLRR